MICPQCGHDMGNAHRCLRCGYEVKNLATVDERRKNDESDGKRDEENNTKIIDPKNVYISTSYDDGYDGGFVDPFASLFEDIFADPITSLLGGLFGFDVRGETQAARRRDEQQQQQKKKKKQGPIVEVDNVEFFDEDGNRIDSDKKHAHAKESHDAHHASDGHRASDGHHTSDGKSKNPFRRNRNQ